MHLNHTPQDLKLFRRELNRRAYELTFEGLTPDDALSITTKLVDEIADYLGSFFLTIEWQKALDVAAAELALVAEQDAQAERDLQLSYREGTGV